MTIYYQSTPFTDVANIGQVAVSSAKRKQFNNASVLYHLGHSTDKGYAYTTEPEDELGSVELDTLDKMADRIGYLTQTPVVYNYATKLQAVGDALRTYVAPLGAPPLSQTPLPAKSGSLSAIPGFERPRSGEAYSGGEFSTPGYVGKNSNWDAIIAAGARIIRLPIRYRNFAPGGAPDTLAADGSKLSGPIDPNLISQAAGWAKYITDKGCAVMFDDHSYRDMVNNDIAQFWLEFDVAFKAACNTRGYPALGTSPLVIYELQNEPSSHTDTYGNAMFRTVHGLRANGVTATLGVGWGFYNKHSYLTQYIASIEAAGGVANLDPLNRLIFLPHDYWEPTGNDQAGKVSGNIVIADRYADMLATARQFGLTLVFGEIGLGGGTPGWLPADSKGPKNGQALLAEFTAWALANTDVLKGTIAWGGGRFAATYSYHLDITTPQGQAIVALWKANV